MSRCVRRLVFTLALAACLSPGRADAGIIAWLDKLSGPGPFWGLEFGIGLHCTAKPIEQQVGALVADDDRRTRNSGGADIDLRSCRAINLADRRWRWALNVGGGLAQNNPVDYGDTGATDSRAVGAFSSGLSLDYSIIPFVELGAGIGATYYSGKRFASFVRPYLEVPRVRVRVISLFPGTEAQKERRGWFVLEAAGNLLLREITNRNFGAPADLPLVTTGHEYRPELGVSVDLFRLFHDPR